MAPHADLAGRPLRMPKLKYRNPLPADQLSLSLQNTTLTPETQPNDQERPSTTSSIASTSSIRQSFDSRSTATSSSLASSSNASTSNESKASKKKKNNGMLSFLTLKEPSQLALEQYAEQQRKEATSRGSSSPASSTSTRKLPASVPKVNSKWDGIPESVKSRDSMSMSSKKRHSTITTASQSSRTSKFTTATNNSLYSIASDGTRNPPNSLASAASSISERRDSGLSSFSSPSTASLPEISYFFPDNPSGILPPSPDEGPPTPLAVPLPTSEPTTPLDLSPEEPFVNEPESPASPIHVVDATVVSKADTIFKRLNERSQGGGFLASEAREVNLPEEEENSSDDIPDTHDFLFEKQPSGEQHTVTTPVTSPPVPDRSPRRPPQNFSRPLLSNQHVKPAPRPVVTSPFRSPPAVTALPTLYEASVASTDTITDIHDLKETSTDDSDVASIAPSIAPSEISTMSASWYRSSRERLGLGGRIRKNDVLPWESQEEPPGKPKKSRLSVFYKNSS